MTIEEAKTKIGQELVSGFREWLTDHDNLTENEFGRKYGWGKGTVKHTESYKSLKVYMEYCFTGRYLPGWVSAGYDKETIYELHREGFLSYQNYSNWKARQTGRTEWYYIPQRTAKEIYKASRG